MKYFLPTIIPLAALAAVPLFAQTSAPATSEARSEKQAERFKAADTNRDGALDRAEWEAQRRANDPFSRADANKDGRLSEAEMQAMRADRRGTHGGRHGDKRGRGNPAALFEKVDANRDGSITSAEWQAAGRKPEGFARFDTSKDGTVTRTEMESAVAAMKARRMEKQGS